MKNVMVLVAALLVVAMVVPAMAEDKPKDDAKPKMERPTAFGKIVSVDKEKIVLKTKKEDKVEEVTFKLASDVKVSIDRQDKTLDDLKPDMSCAVWVKDDKVVRIGVRTQVGGGGKKKPAEPKQ